MAFADKFKLARMQAGLSQEKLATELDISRRMIANYESGQSLPSGEKLSIIARYFGVTIDSLISENEEFIAKAFEEGGAKNGREARALVDQVSAMFAGGVLSEQDMDAAMRAIQNSYWIAKDEAKKYTPKKYRVAAEQE